MFVLIKERDFEEKIDKLFYTFFSSGNKFAVLVKSGNT